MAASVTDNGCPAAHGVGRMDRQSRCTTTTSPVPSLLLWVGSRACRLRCQGRKWRNQRREGRRQVRI